MIVRSIFFLCLFVVVSTTAFAQNTSKVDTLVVGSVIDERSRQGVEATISIIGTDESSIEIPTEENGRFVLTSRDVSRNVAYVATAKSPHKRFLGKTEKLYFKGLEEDDLPISIEFMIRLEGCVFPVPPITFYRKSSKILPEGKVATDGLIEVMLDNPEIVVEMSGHADCSEDDPELLSLQRAQSAIAYMVENEIERDRFVAVGKGCNAPFQMEGGNKFFRKGQVLTPDFISTLTDSVAIEEARRLNGMVIHKLIRTDYVPKK